MAPGSLIEPIEAWAKFSSSAPNGIEMDRLAGFACLDLVHRGVKVQDIHAEAAGLGESTAPQLRRASVAVYSQNRSSRWRSQSPQRPRASHPAGRDQPRHGGGWGASSYSKPVSSPTRAVVASPTSRSKPQLRAVTRTPGWCSHPAPGAPRRHSHQVQNQRHNLCRFSETDRHQRAPR